MNEVILRASMRARASAAKVSGAMVTGLGFMISAAVRVRALVAVPFEEAAEVAVGDHAEEFARLLIEDGGHAEFFVGHLVDDAGALGWAAATGGIASPECMRSLTRARRRPRRPPG